MELFLSETVMFSGLVPFLKVIVDVAFLLPSYKAMLFLTGRGYKRWQQHGGLKDPIHGLV